MWVFSCLHVTLWRHHLEVSPGLLGNLCNPGVLLLFSLLSLVWHIIIIIIIIIAIIIIIISFMQGIYTYIPETNYVPREYSVSAIL